MSALHLAPLPAAQDAAALDLLDQAFAGDPSLAWQLCAERADFAARRRAYLASYLHFHRRNDLPTLAAWQGERLLGLSYFSLGDATPASASLAELGQAIRRQCGEECLARLDRLLEAFERQLPGPCWARIEFLAVAPGQRGRGIGGALLAQTLAHCRQHGCPGVALETGEPRNLALYRRHGLRQSGGLTLPGLQQHYLLQDWRA